MERLNESPPEFCSKNYVQGYAESFWDKTKSLIGGSTQKYVFFNQECFVFLFSSIDVSSLLILCVSHAYIKIGISLTQTNYH